MDIRWAFAIAVLWMICSAWRAFGVLRAAFRVKRLLTGATPVENPSLGPVLSRAGFGRSARLCVSGEVDQPCVIGFFSPRILVPGWLLAKATTAELEQIALHEISHLRRLDDWTNLLQKLALVCFPLNPALVWVEKRLCSEREGACDENVVRATHAPVEYATCLTNLAEERLERRMVGRAALSLGAWEKHSELADRVQGILSRRRLISPAKSRAFAAAMVAATAVAAVELGGMPALVRFTNPQEMAQQHPDLPSPVTRNTVPSARYQDVVFRGRSVAKRATIHPPAAKPIPARVNDLAAESSAAPKAVPVLQRTDAAGRVQAWMVVTRWESWDAASGQRVTVTRIDRVVGAEQRSGWYFVEM
jgi:beta-lactamase regulating signal transducer with metallopeptidase domain